MIPPEPPSPGGWPRLPVINTRMSLKVGTREATEAAASVIASARPCQAFDQAPDETWVMYEVEQGVDAPRVESSPAPRSTRIGWA